MIPAMTTEYEGWKICTACWDENPDDWKEGDPVKYGASGYAELVNPRFFQGTWLSQLRQTVPANKDMLFSDFEAAHAVVRDTLRATIDALKIR